MKNLFYVVLFVMVNFLSIQALACTNEPDAIETQLALATVHSALARSELHVAQQDRIARYIDCQKAEAKASNALQPNDGHFQFMTVRNGNGIDFVLRADKITGDVCSIVPTKQYKTCHN